MTFKRIALNLAHNLIRNRVCEVRFQATRSGFPQNDEIGFTVNRIAEICILAFGWRRALIMLGAGAIAAMSMPPLFFLPALFFSMPLWVWSLDGAERGTGWRLVFGPAFGIGFFFGLGYFLVSVHWIGAAFFVEGGWELLLMPLAVLALAAVLALFWGLASALAHFFWTHSPVRILTLGVALSGAEFLRGHILSGLPFDLLGYALTANQTMMQASSLIGIYGLTFMAVLLALSPALIWPADERDWTTRLLPFFAALLILAAQLGYGQYRLNSIEVSERDDMRLRLVQPNIEQAMKWQAGAREFVLNRLISLSEGGNSPAGAGLTGITHVVWPEAALPFFLSEYPNALVRIAAMLPPGTTLLTGAPRTDPLAGPQGADFNSILAINADGETLASYDKTHLVPFGEYLPFQSFFEKLGLRQFVAGARGWTPGDNRRLLRTPSTPPFLPLICYEAMFSGDLGAGISAAQFMLNLTNDGWFDGSVGPAKLFQFARVRAVEHGVPMVRVANTGFSAMIDPLGRLRAQIRPREAGFIDVSMPQRLEGTLFSKFTNWPFLIALILSALIIAFDRRRRLVRKNI